VPRITGDKYKVIILHSCIIHQQKKYLEFIVKQRLQLYKSGKWSASGTEMGGNQSSQRRCMMRYFLHTGFPPFSPKYFKTAFWVDHKAWLDKTAAPSKNRLYIQHFVCYRIMPMAGKDFDIIITGARLQIFFEDFFQVLKNKHCFQDFFQISRPCGMGDPVNRAESNGDLSGFITQSNQTNR
jgi:hypothetical protein